MSNSAQPPFTIRIRTENNQDMDWMVKPDEVTFLQTLEVFSQIIPQSTHTAFEYEDEDGDRITVRSDEEMRDMFNYYFGELSDEDKARGLLPPLIIFPKYGKTPQNRNIHGLKIKTNGQAKQNQEEPAQHKKVALPAVPQQVGIESILSCGQITKESLHYIQPLGHGNSGKVYRAVHKDSNHIMAVKEIALDISVAVQKQIISELEILYKCNSRMIISFYGAFFCENCVSICTEYMDGGSLDQYMPVPEQYLGQISMCVLEGMLYMWNINILHRDIKPYNILVNSAGEVKLCDFGVSTQLVKSIASTYLGTNVYLSPERVQGQEYGKPAEVWSFGVTLFELATSKLPFKSLNETSTLQPFEIMRVIIDEPQLKLPSEHFSPELLDFVNRCLHKKPALRLSGQDILNHPFIKGQSSFDPSLISQLVMSKQSTQNVIQS